MLMNMADLLKVAKENKFAVPAFNIGSDQLLKAVMKKVNELQSPVILEMSPDEFRFVGYSQIQAMIYEATRTNVPVVIHLDHGDTYAHLANVSVESELGTIGTTGNSIEGGTQGVIYTVPAEAKQFIEDTGIDTFAVAIGTAHGIYPSNMKPKLRIDILDQITEEVTIPLVLHGGSSNKDEEIAAAVKHGISKINISSDIKSVFYKKTREVLNANPDYREPLEIYPEGMKECERVVEEKCRLFDSVGKASLYTK